MKKMFLSFIIAGLFANGIWAQSSIFTPNWTVGEKHVFTFEKTQTDWSELGGFPQDDRTSETYSRTADFEVIAKDDAHYRLSISHTFDDIEYLDAAEQLLDSMGINIPEEFSSMNIIYTTDHKGTFENIENLEEITDRVRFMIDSVIEPLLSKATDNEEGPVLMLSLLKMQLLDPDYLPNVVSPDLKLLHFIYPFVNLGLTVDDAVIYKSETSTPVGFSIDTKNVIYVDTLLPEQNLCIVKQTSQLDEKETLKYLAKFFKSMPVGKNGKKELKKALKEMSMLINDEIEIMFDTKLTLPRQTTTKRSVVVTTPGRTNHKEVETVLRLVE